MTKTLYKKKMVIIDIIVFTFLLLLDQVTKLLIKYYFFNENYILIQDVLGIKFQKNTGGPWGILKEQSFLFVFVAAVILFCIIYVLIKIPDKKKYSALHVVLAGVSAGVCGNVADRLLHGYVIDFISIEMISFPIFNFADIFVTVFSVVLIFLFVFKYKENDLLFMDIKQKKYRELK